ncbi:hypothetical protein EYC84_007486 [Monilinia fructicola]|uniref:DUS-like FMN-binding domain-containing protein n=1 Tax=Monilinia fructicola TaxID=38448 RepID=A0A5M9JGE8_MONFR|nr:hypothetical protein EYC84_007486 [Monilinia fructicola]
MTVSNDLPVFDATHRELKSHVAEKKNDGSNGPLKKPHGRAFYESIGSPKFILAPMVDQSEFAWRMLSRSFMTPESNKSLLAYTPMLHARMFSETPKFRDAHFQPMKTSLVSQLGTSSPAHSDDLFLDGNPEFDRPLFVQFCANDEKELLEGAKYVAPFCDAVDLNLGCPQGIARKGKILETKEKTLEYANMVLSAGASILTVHGRTREMKGHKTGLADWGVLRFLRENLPKEVVLFANGNILARDDIDECLKATGADGVMSAEGNLYDPTIFSDAPAIGEEGREYWRSLDGTIGGWRMDAVLRRYMDIIYKYVLQRSPPERKPLFITSDPQEEMWEEVGEEEEGEEGPPKKKQKGEKKERTTSPSLVAMQPHCFKLLRPLVSKHHDIRDALAKCRAGDIQAFENVLQMTEKAVKEGIIEYERTNGESYREEVERAEREREEKMKGGGKGANGRGGADGDGEGKGGEDLKFEESSLETVRRCKRPWWVVQPYVRPLPMEALAKGSLTLSRKERGEKAKGKGEGDAEKDEGKLVHGVEIEEQEKVEVQVVGDQEGSNPEKETVEVPKDGLVCG